MSQEVQLTRLPNANNTRLVSMDIELTLRAMEQFKLSYLGSEIPQDHVRIGVKGGGCSGYQFVLEFIDEDQVDKDEDLIEQIGSLKFVMDIFSKEYLKGTVIDHVKSLKETGFKFENPNSKKTCGCGSSFSV
jgi:iron-sulfur cluster assembly protein